MDRYLVGRVLGEGGFGITYIGCDLRLELKVAIKEYYPVDKVSRNTAVSEELVSFSVAPARSGFERGKTRFLQEARTMAKMDKQQVIVGVRDFFETNNTAYIVMEYIEGTTFTDLVAQRGGRIPPDELFTLIKPLFSALSNLHRAGLIHRDISPDNLMLEDGEVRLIDFGCARDVENGNETLTITLKHGYAPIEQYQTAGGQGPWTDVYALCATIYFCLVGQKPPQALNRIGSEKSLILPSKLGINLSPQQEEAIMHGLNLSPKNRYQSMEELQGALYAPSVLIPEPDPIITQDDDLTKDISQEQTLDEPTPMPLPDPKKDFWRRSLAFAHRHILSISAGAAVLLLLILAVQLIPGNTSVEKEKKENTIVQSDQTSADEVQEEPSINWEEAHLLTAQEMTMEGLQQLMDDPSVTALVLPSGVSGQISYLTDGSLFTLTKPMQIQTGAQLDVDALCIDGEGFIQVQGSLVLDDGNLQMKGEQLRLSFSDGLDGHLSCARGFLWMEGGQNLKADDQSALRNIGGYSLVFKEEMDKAKEVTSLQELIACIDQEIPQGIKITKDITLNREISLACPVYIAEGVTVSAGYVEGQEPFSLVLYADTSVLINYGTCEASVWMDQGAAFINYGSFSGRKDSDVGNGGVWLCEDSYSVIYNEGYMLHGDCSRLWQNNHLLNTPSGTLDAENFFLLNASLSNYGTLTAMGKGESLNLNTGSRLHNFGTLTVNSQAEMCNNGLLYNKGSLLVESDGKLWNEYLVENDFGTLRAEAGAILLGPPGFIDQPANGGYISTGGTVELLCSDPPVVYSVANEQQVTEIAQNASAAATQEQLDSLMNEIAVDAIAISGNVIYTGECKITKDLYITGNLTVTDGDLVSVASKVILADGASLTVDGVTLLDGAAMQLDSSTLTVAEGGQIYLDGSVLQGSGDSRIQAAGTEIQLRNHSLIVPEADCSSEFFLADNSHLHIADQSAVLMPMTNSMTVLSDVTMDIEDARFSGGGNLMLRSCTLNIGQRGIFTEAGNDLCLENSTVSIAEQATVFSNYCNVQLRGTTITNDGFFVVGGWDEIKFVQQDSVIYNNGKAEINPPHTITGESKIYNKGALQTVPDHPFDTKWIEGNAQQALA